VRPVAQQPGEVARAQLERPRRLRPSDLQSPPELGLGAWARTAQAAIARLNAAVRDAVSRPAVRQRMAAVGPDPVALSPTVFAAVIRSERETWGRVVREAHIMLG
jgi:tripartite-type tricarboxylate transporter receptor subunit TctC